MSDKKLIDSNWVKIVYKENDTDVRVKQGFLTDEGNFYKIVGDFKTTFINKNFVIMIEVKNKEETDGNKHKEN